MRIIFGFSLAERVLGNSPKSALIARSAYVNQVEQTSLRGVCTTKILHSPRAIRVVRPQSTHSRSKVLPRSTTTGCKMAAEYTELKKQFDAYDEKAINLIEAAKRKAAIRAVDEHFKPDMRYVGIGSGTTIQYVVEEIKNRIDPHAKYPILFVPTGFQSRSEIEKRGLIAFPFDSLPIEIMLDVTFDGADEVDDDLNLIKGGGACLFQEKLVAMRARKFVCVADYRKDVSRLLTDWSYIPIEVIPIAEKTVRSSLKALGCPDPQLRMIHLAKTGPLKTDQDNYIVMAPFPKLLVEKDLKAETGLVGAGESTGKTKDGLDGRVWEVNKLATAIKSITGVLEVGLFVGMNGPEASEMQAGRSSIDAGAAASQPEGAVAGHRESTGIMVSQGGQKPVAVYFGMQDGSVKVRTAPRM